MHALRGWACHVVELVPVPLRPFLNRNGSELSNIIGTHEGVATHAQRTLEESVLEYIVHLCFQKMSLEEVSSQHSSWHSCLQTSKLAIPVALHHVRDLGSFCTHMLVKVIGRSVLLRSETRQSHYMFHLVFAELHLLHENAVAFQAWIRRGGEHYVNPIKHAFKRAGLLVVHFNDLMRP